MEVRAAPVIVTPPASQTAALLFCLRLMRRTRPDAIVMALYPEQAQALQWHKQQSDRRHTIGNEQSGTGEQPWVELSALGYTEPLFE